MKRKSLILCMFTIVLYSCQKDFLEEKPDKSLLIPTSLSDFRALLDNSAVFNQIPFLAAVSNDDVFTNSAGYNSAPAIIRNAMIWKETDFYDATVNVPDWNNPYQAIYYANTILDGLELFRPANDLELSQANELRGQALFFRAFAFHYLVQTFSVAYVPATAQSSLGLPIRLSSDVKVKSVRSSLKETYGQIINDLLESIKLLPLQTAFKTRPKKDAAYALLAKVYLEMQDYQNALQYAEECLKGNSELIDFNSLNSTAARPFPSGSFKDQNTEVIFYCTVQSVSYLTGSANTLINSELYNSFHLNDLRKNVFFSTNVNGVIFKGNYTGNSGVFAGLSLDEVYLIKAECQARLGSYVRSMQTLNLLMKKRWRATVAYPEFSASNSEQALSIVLDERRKELVYRNNRWADLKRLNLDSRFAITLTRNINNITYVLPPNDPKYVLPIPDAEIFNNGLTQNDR